MNGREDDSVGSRVPLTAVAAGGQRGGCPTLIRIAGLFRAMSLFRKAGEKFEETKRAFVDGDGPESGAEYVCRSCEETVSDDHEYCPHCGEDSVEAVA